MKLWLILGAAFLLPLCAADAPYRLDAEEDDDNPAHTLITQIFNDDSLSLKKQQFLALCIAAHYDRKSLFFDLVDTCVGNQKIELPNNDVCYLSKVRDAIKISISKTNTTGSFEVENSRFAKATKKYLDLLQRNNIFTKKDQLDDSDLQRRMSIWQEHVDFLQQQRVSLFIQDDKLIRYDTLSNSVTVFAYKKNRSSVVFLNPRHTRVPIAIDPHSIRLEKNGKDITYTVFEDDEPEDTDSLVEVTDDE